MEYGVTGMGHQTSNQVKLSRRETDAVNDTVAVGAVAYSGKRLRRTPDDTL